MWGSNTPMGLLLLWLEVGGALAAKRAFDWILTEIMMKSKYVDMLEEAGRCVQRIGLCKCGQCPLSRTSLGDALFEASIRANTFTLGKPQHKKSTVQTVFVQIAFQPPHPQANGRFVGAIFAENLSIF